MRRVAAEQSGLAVSFGFVVVARPAASLDVGVAGRTVVGDWIDVVVLQPPAAVAVDALATGEPWYRTKVEGGAQLCRLIAPKAFDGVNVDPVVQDCVEESVFAKLPGQLDRDGATIYDVANLAMVGMAPPPGEQVTHDHQLGTVRSFRCAVAGGQGRHGISGMVIPPSWGDIGRLAGLAILPVLPAAPEGGQLDAPEKRKSRLWRQRPGEADHAQTVAPVPEEARLLLLAVKVPDVGVGLAVLAGLFAQSRQIRGPGHGQERAFGARYF